VKNEVATKLILCLTIMPRKREGKSA